MAASLQFRFHQVADVHVGRAFADQEPVADEFEFRFQLAPNEYQDLTWYLEEYMDLPDGGATVRARRIEDALRQWGRLLFDGIASQDAVARRMNEFLALRHSRTLTIVSHSTGILCLPWELMSNEQGPLSAQGVIIRRQLDAQQVGECALFERPLRALFVVSRPDDLRFIDPRHSLSAMFEALAPLGNQVEIDFCRPATWDRAVELLQSAHNRNQPYHILHFNGHGSTDRQGNGFLCFEKRRAARLEPTTRRVYADKLGHELSRLQTRFVVLEACRGARIELEPLKSVAPRLIESGVGNVVAMSHAIHVEAARILVRQLYQTLTQGGSIGEAVAAGREALRNEPARWIDSDRHGRRIALSDWFLPHLYQRGDDQSLVSARESVDATAVPPQMSGDSTSGLAPGETAATTGTVTESGQSPVPASDATTARVSTDFPPPPRNGFFGRARELHAIERALIENHCLLLHAMGGMGKTALASEAARWLTKTGFFPDGACFLSFEQPVTAEKIAYVLGSFLEGTDFERLSEDDRMRRAAELFRQRRVLMVWDNYESMLPAFTDDLPAERSINEHNRRAIAELFRAWTVPAATKGRLLVTSRPAETGLAVSRSIELNGLSRPDSLFLLARIMQRHGVPWHDDQRYSRARLERLLDVLGDHPFSIELVGPHLGDLEPARIVADFLGLLDSFRGQGDDDGDDRSLLASLRFSMDRLSPLARTALPWLGLFRVGVFELFLLHVTQFEAESWDHIRRELEATALVRVENHVQVNDRPYLRFHPTLPYAAAFASDPLPADAQQRFVDVYRAVTATVGKSFRENDPRAGSEMISREEANFRQAVAWALEQKNYVAVSAMGDVFREHLHRLGRRAECAAWVNWLAEETEQAGFISPATERYFDQSWLLANEGQVDQAIERLGKLIEQLKSTTEFNAVFQIALGTKTLGEVYDRAGRFREAVTVLEDAVRQWEALIDEQADPQATEYERGNLANTLGSLANALVSLGRLKEALHATKRSIRLFKQLGNKHEIASSLAQFAGLLRQVGRLSAADGLYSQALTAAQDAADKELEAVVLQNQAILSDDLGHTEQASRQAQVAMKLFRAAGNESGEMNTSNLLGVFERKLDRLPEARQWLSQSLEIAQRRADRHSIGIAVHNLGLVCQHECEAALAADDRYTARDRLAESRRHLDRGLTLFLEAGNESYQGSVRRHLAQLEQVARLLDSPP